MNYPLDFWKTALYNAGMATTVTSQILSKRRRFALDKIAQDLGFPSWTRFSTHVKRAVEQGKPINVMIGTGKDKQVFSTKGLTGS